MDKGKAGRLPTPKVGKGARCADPVPTAVPATGKPWCSESCTPGLARGGWKSAGNSNSLAAYSTACPVWSGGKAVRPYLSLQKVKTGCILSFLKTHREYTVLRDLLQETVLGDA